MKATVLALATAAMFALCLPSTVTAREAQTPREAQSPREAQTPRTPQTEQAPLITWDKSSEKVIAAGGYPRVHRLNDGRLMLVFFSGRGSSCCFSSDNGHTWSEPQIIWHNISAENESGRIGVMTDNPEFAQLPDNHPHHPGRIIFATNMRPQRAQSSIYPYSIAISSSDDNGSSWSGIATIFQSDKWPENAVIGCWEPFVNVLDDGTVQIYFSDETPYYRRGHKFQNISVVESHDGGDTWGEVRQVAYTKGYRDGMPVVLRLDGKLYLAIEHKCRGKLFHPQIIKCDESDNWSHTRQARSNDRFNPLQKPLDSKRIYAGAPYLISTDNYIVLSWQSSEGSAENDHTHAVMEVAACKKSEMDSKGKFTAMRGTTRPFSIDQTSGSALWNSLCDLGDDWVLAVSSTSSGIRICRGKLE